MIVARGELDLVTAPLLRDALKREELQAPVTVLDLREVGFIDSSGLSVIVECHQRTKLAGMRFAVAVGPESQVRRLLVLAGLGETLELVAEPDDVIAPDGRPEGA